MNSNTVLPNNVCTYYDEGRGSFSIQNHVSLHYAETSLVTITVEHISPSENKMLIRSRANLFSLCAFYHI